MRFIRCDRCHVGAEMHGDSPPGWEMVSFGSPDDPFDPLHAEAIDVCPACQTAEERTDFLLRDVAETVEEGT